MVFILLEWLWGDIPCPGAKEKPQQDGKRRETAFRIKPYTRQGCSEGSNIPCVHHDPETPQRLRQNCVWVSPEEMWVGSGLLRGLGLWVQQTWVWHRPSWRRSPLTQIELPELTQDWGNRLWEGTNRTLCAPGPRRNKQWPYKRLTQTCPWVSRSLWWRCGMVMACCMVVGTECSNACMGPFEGGLHSLHCLHHSLAQIR